MKFKLYIPVILLLCIIHTNAQQVAQKTDSLSNDYHHIIDTDSLLEIFSSKDPNQAISLKKPVLTSESKTGIKGINIIPEKQAFDSLITVKKISSRDIESPFFNVRNLKYIHIDTIILSANPFFIDLVYENIPLNFNWNLHSDFRHLYYGKKATGLIENTYEPIKTEKPEQFITGLRREARDEITRKAADLYITTFDKLPDPRLNQNHLIKEKPLNHVQFVDENEVFYDASKKLRVRKAIIGPWAHKASVLAQFSENTVSPNWYQGGNNYLAVLGILAGQLNYDNQKFIQWDNYAEWHMGFNSGSPDDLHKISPNDDILKVNSKLGIKAGGNWFYSGSVDFSTQFFNSYKNANSLDLKTSFLTPIRLNVGVGFDYKYKKVFSLMLSPVSFKYIYLNNPVVDPNLFGIKAGQNTLSEIGSSFKAIVSYAPTREIQLDSRLSFYTNYQKVEIDWEMVCNFTINRFMSTRISFNPRYDNTVIEENGQYAKIQYKQLLSVGFAHKFR